MQLDKDQYRQVFGLTVKQGAIVTLFGLALLLITNFNLLLSQLTRGTILGKPEVQDSFALQIQDWLNAVPILNLFVLVLFWISVGLVAYAVLYWVYSTISEAHNEVAVEQEYVNRGDKKSRIHRPTIEVGLAALLVVLGIITVWVLFPLFSGWFVNFILNIYANILIAILWLLASLLGMLATIYVFKVVISYMLVLE